MVHLKTWHIYPLSNRVTYPLTRVFLILSDVNIVVSKLRILAVLNLGWRDAVGFISWTLLWGVCFHSEVGLMPTENYGAGKVSKLPWSEAWLDACWRGTFMNLCVPHDMLSKLSFYRRRVVLKFNTTIWCFFCKESGTDFWENILGFYLQLTLWHSCGMGLLLSIVAFWSRDLLNRTTIACIFHYKYRFIKPLYY